MRKLTKEQIVCRASRLNRSDRRWIAGKILSDLEDEPMDHQDRLFLLIAKAEEATDHSLLKTKDAHSTMIRRFVAKRLYTEHFSYYEIGKLLCRRHSSIIALVRSLDDILSFPKAYPHIIKQYKKFNELVDEFDNE